MKLVDDVCHADDLYRAEMAQEMLFKSAAIWPNLYDTTYAFTSPQLLGAQLKFHEDFKTVSGKVAAIMTNFMPLLAGDPKGEKYPEWYLRTISANIQY